MSYLSLAERGVPRSIAVPSSSHGTRQQSGRREAADQPPHTHTHTTRKSEGRLGLGVRRWRMEEGWRGSGGGPSRAQRSRAKPLPTVNPKERVGGSATALQNLPPCLTGNFGFTGGGGRGEGRREAEGAGKPAGAGSRAEPGQPGGSEAEGSARISPAPAAPRSPRLCSGCVRCVAEGRSPGLSREVTITSGRRRAEGNLGAPSHSWNRRKGLCEGGSGFGPWPRLRAAVHPQKGRCRPPLRAPGLQPGDEGAGGPGCPPRGAAPRGLRGCHSPPGNPACPPGINSLVLINKCISPS